MKKYNNKKTFILFLSLFIIFIIVFVVLILKTQNKQKFLCINTTLVSNVANNSVTYRDLPSNISIKLDYNSDWPVSPFEYNQESKEILFGKPFFGHEPCQNTLDRNFLTISKKTNKGKLLSELKKEYGDGVSFKTINTKFGEAYLVPSMDAVYDMRASVLIDDSQIDIYWSGDEKSLANFILNNIAK